MLSPELHAELADYAAAYAEAYGQSEPVAELIPAMLAAFIEGDRAFGRRRPDAGRAHRLRLRHGSLPLKTPACPVGPVCREAARVGVPALCPFPRSWGAFGYVTSFLTTLSRSSPRNRRDQALSGHLGVW